MSEVVKRVNGHVIKVLTKEEINKELIANNDWTIEYYVPGRKFRQYFITINRNRIRTSYLEKLEKLCNEYKLAELKNMEFYQIEKLMDKYINIGLG